MQHNPYIENRSRMYDEVQRANRNADRVTTDCARAIASDWHDGQGSALYAFSSSGHFDASALLREVEAELAHPGFSTIHERDAAALNALYHYVRDRAR